MTSEEELGLLRPMEKKLKILVQPEDDYNGRNIA